MRDLTLLGVAAVRTRMDKRSESRKVAVAALQGLSPEQWKELG